MIHLQCGNKLGNMTDNQYFQVHYCIGNTPSSSGIALRVCNREMLSFVYVSYTLVLLFCLLWTDGMFTVMYGHHIANSHTSYNPLAMPIAIDL